MGKKGNHGGNYEQRTFDSIRAVISGSTLKARQWFPKPKLHINSDSYSAGTGLSPALRCGQSSKLKKAVFKTSDASESEERKQKQGCVFVAHPFFSRPRETLPSKVVL